MAVNWTVKDLKEELDGYGDHLIVRVDVERGAYTTEYTDFDVSYTSTPEGVVVTLTVDAS